jgi:hypothetical protein
MVSPPPEESRFAGLSGEGILLSECLTTRDHEGARLSTQLMRALAVALGLDRIRSLAERVLLHLGPAGSLPSSWVGPAAWALAQAVMDEAG